MKPSLFCLVFILFLLSNTKSFSTILIDQALLERILTTFGQKAVNRTKQWRDILDQLADKSDSQKLVGINDFFNTVNFIDDKEHWGQEDYWATPVEFLASNGGDCEDFTIAKYFSLVELGFNKEKLRLMYVTATEPEQAHMVLAYYETPKAIPLVLDNLNKRILPANKRPDLIPIYSFNGDGLWLAKEQGRGRMMQQGGNNKLWQELNERISNGF